MRRLRPSGLPHVIQRIGGGESHFGMGDDYGAGGAGTATAVGGIDLNRASADMRAAT